MLKVFAVREMIPSLVWTVLVSIGSLLPKHNVPQQFLQLSDKLLHVLMYFILSFLVGIGLSKQNKYPEASVKAIAIAVIYSAFVGILMEGLQTFVPGRYGDWIDVVANLLGVLVAVPLLFWIRSRCRSEFVD